MPGGDTVSVEVKVAAGEESFASSVVDGLEAVDERVTASVFEPDAGEDTLGNGSDVDGIVVDDRLGALADLIDRLTTRTDLPVILLADTDSEQAISTATEAGVTDVFPRVASRAQQELVVECVAGEGHADAGPGFESRSGTGERAYREVFENVSDGLVVHDPETGEIVDVNERFCEMNGYNRRELVGTDIGAVTAPAPEYSAEVAQERIQTAREEGPQLFEWRNQRQDGSCYPVEVHLAVVDLNGTERVLASVRDITERVERERELAEQRRLYSTLVEQSPNGVMIVQDKQIELVNEQMATLTGRTESDLLGRPFYELMTPEYRDLVERRYEQRASGEEPPNNYEIEIQTASGERRVIDLHVSRIQYEGEPATLASFNDITDARRRERALRESERRLRLIAEHIDEIIYLAAADFSEILYINPAYEEIYGRPVEELSENPQAFVEAAHPDDKARYRADVDRLIEDIEAGDPQDVYEGEYRLERDGETRWVTVTRFPVENEDGTIDRIVGRVQDVTARKRREQEYEQIFHGVNDSVVIHDLETAEMIEVNDTFCDLVGYDREELLKRGTAGVSVVAEGYTADRAADIIAEVRETGEKGPFEWKVETADGDHRLLEVTATAAEIGGERRHVSLMRDITERHRREQEYEQIFHGVNDGIAIQNPETAEIVDVNRTFVERLGYDDAETVLEQGYEGIAATDAGYTIDRAQELCRRVMETGDSETVEWQIDTEDGQRLLIEATVAPAIINGEQRIISIQRDITERQQLERRLQTIADRIEEVIHFVDADAREVLFVNSAFADVFGRPVEEIYDDIQVLFETLHPEAKAAYRGEIEAMLADMQAGDPEDSYEFEYRIERPDGEQRWLESTVYPLLDDATDSHRYIGVTKDVTEQQRYRQTLETFHGATRELTAADSREEACRHAVQAAEEVLGFPLVSAHLYDDTTGRLEPTASTTRLEELDVDLPAFGPGDSLPWQVFVEGDSVTSTEPAVGIYGPGVSAPDVVLPLGSHGVMLVGAPSDSFGTEDIDLAQILAATLEAALNHVAGERALEEREQELRRQQERAEQFERLNTVIRDIEQATVEQSSRSGIEEAVCDRLVDIDVHDLVWTAEHSVGDDELVPRSSVGGKESYLDALTIDIEAGAGGHPALVAYRNGEPRVVENVATDVTGGGWRKRALQHGIQSVVAVPIRYESSIHGVLTVESSVPDAFDETTQEILADLGRSIGYAITVTEREQALESEGTTELEFAVDDEGLFMVRAATTADCRIDLERTIRRTGGSFSMFYLVDGVDPNELVDLASAAPSVETAQVVSVEEDHEAGLIEVTAPTWFGSVFTEHGAVVREASVDDNGGTMLVEAPRGADIRSLVEGFQERYPETELVAQRQRERTIRSLFELQDALRQKLTDRQWEALETAYSAGYFAWPREVSGEEVATLLGVSQPTFNKHLRVAERTAFQMLLDREYPEAEET